MSSSLTTFLSGHLTRLAGANPQRAALCPPLPGRWSSVGLSAALAAHVAAASLALAVARLVAWGHNWSLSIGMLVYVVGLLAMMRNLPKALQQFDRPGPDLLAARWVLAGLLGSLMVGVALALAWPYEVILTGSDSPSDWLALTGPLALLRWTVRGVILAALSVPLVARRGLARSAAYGSLCDANYQLGRLTAARSSTTS